MEHIGDVLFRLISGSIKFPEYRPPRIESPIENELYNAFRFVGLVAETQFALGPYRVDMLVSSRVDQTIKVLVECDGAQFHHQIVDDFRDDHLVTLTQYPIAHFSGEWINKASEAIATCVIERWFSGHIDTMGYVQAKENAKKQTYDKEQLESNYPFNPQKSLFPLGYVALRHPKEEGRFRAGQWENSLTIRNITRYVVGKTDSLTDFELNNFIAANIDVNEIRERLLSNSLDKLTLSNSSLALVYLYLMGVYHSESRSVIEGQIDDLVGLLTS